MTDPKNTTDFGYQAIPTHEKTARVGEVFHSVADKYDLMNDVMSLGIHRLWKRFAVDLCQLHPGQRVLDLAGGTGDLTLKMLRQVGNSGQVVLADINETMLTVGRDRLMDGGYLNDHLAIVLANAETLPFPDNYFDRIMMGFGLRNLTDKAAALTSMYRVLKPGGRLIILEFSKPTLELLTKGYDWYSFNLVPKLGKWIAKDEASYQYLVESIRRHPDQDTLAELMSHCGFDRCDYHNLTGGIVALHRGYKF